MKKEYIFTVLYYLILNAAILLKTNLDFMLLSLLTSILFSSIFVFIAGLLSATIRKVIYILFALAYSLVIMSNILMINIKNSVVSITSFNLYDELINTQKESLVLLNMDVLILSLLFLLYVFLIVKNTTTRRIKLSIGKTCIVVISIVLVVVFSLQKDKLLFKHVYDNNKYVEEFGLQSFYFREVFNFTKLEFDSKPVVKKEYIQDVIEEEDISLREKKNVVVILAESLDYIAINEDVMPTLNMMMKDGMSFNNFYTITTSTHGSEYSLLTGMYPHANGALMYDYKKELATLPKAFKKQGYCTYGFHANYGDFYDRDYVYSDLYGFDYKYFINDFDQESELTLTQWPSDLTTFNKSVRYIASNGCDKNLTFYMTISGHSPYAYYSRQEIAQDYEYIESLYPSYDDPLISYLSTQMQLDKMLSEMVTYYTSTGEINETVFIITTDHYPYAMATDNPPYTTYSKSYMAQNKNMFDLEKAPFIIYAFGEEQEDIDTYGSTIDVLPTIADYLDVELENELVLGSTLLDGDGDVMWLSNREYSYLSEDGYYDGVEKKSSFLETELEELINEMTELAISYYSSYE